MIDPIFGALYENMKPKVGSLFSGIGGFDLGLERVGFEIAWQVECDKNCNQILAKHWPECKKYERVEEVGKHNLSPVDLICGGFPCQDLSVAGKRAGLSGERSGLWFEFARIIDELAPKWVLIENVPGLLSSDRGNDFRVIIQWLAERGYGVAWRVFDSQYFGLAQRRKRVFIVGSLGSGRAAQVLFESACVCGDSPKGRKTGEDSSEGTGNCPSPTGWDYQRMRLHGAESIAPTMSQSDGKGGQRVPIVAMTLNAKGGSGRLDGESETFICDARGLGEGHICPSLVGDHINRITDYTPIISIRTDQVNSNAWEGRFSEECAHTIDGASGQAIAQQVQWASGGGAVLNDTVQALRSGAEHNYQFVKRDMLVRRLTPTECERLQGFPDGWTAGLSDSARYRAIGNAVSVPVIEWIGRRILEAIGALN